MPFETRAQFERRVRERQARELRGIAGGLTVFSVALLMLAALIALA